MTDPVCGMTVDPARSHGPVIHDGHSYYFCNPLCQRRFAADPNRYLGDGPVEPMPAPPKTTSRYVCPMCPGVESPVPGPCPRCGMPLELADGDAGDAPDPEYLDFRRRLLHFSYC